MRSARVNAGHFLGMAIAIMLVAGGASAANSLLNPGFETGSGADAENWNEIEVAGGTLGASATADRVSLMPNSGAYSMYLDVIGAADFGPVAEIQQQTLVGSVTPGETYGFSFQSKGVAGPGSVGFYEVLWFDGDGSNGGGPQGSATGLQNYGLGAAYGLTQMSGLVAPATADSVLVQIRLVTGAFAGASGSAYIDDVLFDVEGGGPPPLPMGVNILENAGFESGSGTTADSWTGFAGANGTAGRGSSMPQTDAYSAELSFDNTGSPAPGAYFIEQNLGANTVLDDVNYDLAFAAKVSSTDFTGQDIFFQLQWLDQDGSDGGGFKGQLQQGLIPLGLNSEYQNFVFNDIDVPAGADSFLLRFQVAAGAVGGIANTLFIDDVYLGEVVAAIPGDADGDGDVDGDDFNAWGGNFPTASGATLAQGDFDADGDVDGDDFNVWGGNFPYPAPAPGSSAAAVTPEPASFALLGLGGLSLLRRRA